MSTMSFKDSGMLLSEWIKLHQNSQTKLGSSRTNITKRSAYTLNEGNLNRSTGNIAIVSQKGNYNINTENRSSSESSSVQSVQSMPSVYMKKMRLENMKQENNLNGKIYQKYTLTNKGKNSPNSEQWFKMTTKRNIVKFKIEEVSKENFVILPPIAAVNSTELINKKEYLQVSDVDSKARETNKGNIVILPLISTNKLNETINKKDKFAERDSLVNLEVKNSLAETNQVNFTQETESIETNDISKANLISSPVIVSLTNTEENKEITSNKKDIDQKEELNNTNNSTKTQIADELMINNEKEDVLLNPIVALIITDADPKVANEHKNIEKNTKVKINQEKKEIITTNNNSKDFNNISLSKVIQDLDEMVERDLNQLTLNDDLTETNPQNDQLLDKILSKDFQKNVDNFLKSNEYQESFYESCKTLTQ